MPMRMRFAEDESEKHKPCSVHHIYYNVAPNKQIIVFDCFSGFEKAPRS